MTDTERLDIMEEMMVSGENIKFMNSTWRNKPIALFTISGQWKHGNNVRMLIDAAIKDWIASGHMPNHWRKYANK